MRGKLIVFEGLDRAGKSTQSESLVSSLQTSGHQVLHIRFPDRTTIIGKMINNYLQGSSEVEDHVIHLLFSANRWEIAPKIKAAIEEGKTVVVDRYYYSGAVYSAAKLNPSIDLCWALQADVGLPKPDMTLFLEISPEEAAKRGGYGQEKYESQQMQDRVRQKFKELFGSGDFQEVVSIHADGSFEEVKETILGVVMKKIAEVDSNQEPLGVLES